MGARKFPAENFVSSPCRFLCFKKDSFIHYSSSQTDVPVGTPHFKHGVKTRRRPESRLDFEPRNLRADGTSPYRGILFHTLFTRKTTLRRPRVGLSAPFSLLAAMRAAQKCCYLPEEHTYHMIPTFPRDLSRRTPRGTNQSDG